MQTVELERDQVVAVEGTRWRVEIVEDGTYELRLHIETYNGWCNIGVIKCNSDGSWTIDMERDTR